MRMLRIVGLIWAATLVTSFTPTPACADSWMLPSRATYMSCGGNTRVIVTPRDLESQLAYFEDKVSNAEPAGQEDKGVRAATARLERLSGKRWQMVWEKKIVNDVAPVMAIVRDDGEYVATFDDWHGVGYGPNAVVVYGHGGERIRSFSLSDILPNFYIEALPHSVSSIHWRGLPRFSDDGRSLLIPVTVPSETSRSDAATINLAIDLANGTISPMDEVGWQSALETGRTVRAARIAAEATEKAKFLAPLSGPSMNNQRAWHEYLREAYARLAGDDDTPSTTVLREPTAKDYAISEKWVRDALTDSYTDKVALASLSAPNLVTVLERTIAAVRPGSLSKVTIFVAVGDEFWPAIQAAMQRSGAKLIQLDPNEPIPQRPERIARRYGSQDGD